MGLFLTTGDASGRGGDGRGGEGRVGEGSFVCLEAEGIKDVRRSNTLILRRDERRVASNICSSTKGEDSQSHMTPPYVGINVLHVCGDSQKWTPAQTCSLRLSLSCRGNLLAGGRCGPPAPFSPFLPH